MEQTERPLQASKQGFKNKPLNKNFSSPSKSAVFNLGVATPCGSSAFYWGLRELLINNIKNITFKKNNIYSYYFKVY